MTSQDRTGSFWEFRIHKSFLEFLWEVFRSGLPDNQENQLMVVLTSHPSSSISLYLCLSLPPFSQDSERPLPWPEPHQLRSLLMDTVLGTSFTATQAEYQWIRPFRISDSFQKELSPCLTSLRDVKSHKCFSSHSQVLSRMHELFPAQPVLHILMHLRTLYMHMFHLSKGTLVEFFRFSPQQSYYYVAHGRISWSQGMLGKRIVLTPWYILMSLWQEASFRC